MSQSVAPLVVGVIALTVGVALAIDASEVSSRIGRGVAPYLGRDAVDNGHAGPSIVWAVRGIGVMTAIFGCAATAIGLSLL